jgi:hypothetical protein
MGRVQGKVALSLMNNFAWGLRIIGTGTIKTYMGMERIEPGMEEWIPIGADDDGTQAFLDVKNITRDLDTTTVFKAWVKHVMPSGSPSYKEIMGFLKKAKKNLASPDHVKQVVEIDCAKDVSRNLHLVVCDKQSRILDVISFRFPEWTGIKERGILDKVKESIRETFPDATQPLSEPLKFSRPRIAVNTVHQESPEASLSGEGSNGDSSDPVLPASRRQQMPGQPAIQNGTLKLQQADLVR